LNGIHSSVTLPNNPTSTLMQGIPSPAYPSVIPSVTLHGVQSAPSIQGTMSNTSSVFPGRMVSIP
jgi:hypothetical protein